MWEGCGWWLRRDTSMVDVKPGGQQRSAGIQAVSMINASPSDNSASSFNILVIPNVSWQNRSAVQSKLRTKARFQHSLYMDCTSGSCIQIPNWVVGDVMPSKGKCVLESHMFCVSNLNQDCQSLWYLPLNLCFKMLFLSILIVTRNWWNTFSLYKSTLWLSLMSPVYSEKSEKFSEGILYKNWTTRHNVEGNLQFMKTVSMANFLCFPPFCSYSEFFLI